MNFVYLTTNLINRKQYVGSHIANNINEDEYLGSGILFNKAIKKYGKENFKRKILENTKTRNEAFLLEEFYIRKYNTLKPNGYNLSPTGGLGIPGCLTEESRLKRNKKISSTLKGRKLPKETKRKISKILLEKNMIRSEETKRKISKANKNRKHTKKSKKNMSLGHIGIKMPKRNLYVLISPEKEKFKFKGEEILYKFIKEKKMSLRLIKDWMNKGEIKIKRISELTKNTKKWEIKKIKL
jgi:group I intron endonuclease